MTYKVLESILQMDNGIGSVWDQTTIPVPNKVLAYATNTKILKLGDGVTLFKDLPVFMDLSKAVNAYTFTTRFDPITGGDASKLISVSESGTKYDYHTLTLGSITTISDKDLALANKAVVEHTHVNYLSLMEANDIVNSYTLSSGDEDTIGYLLLQSLAEEERTALQLSNGFVDEYIDTNNIDASESLASLSTGHIILPSISTDTTNHVPSALTESCMTKIDNDIYVYGGYRTDLALNQNILWKYDTVDLHWKRISVGPIKPIGAKMVSIGTKLYIIGGKDDTDIGNVIYYDTLYEYDTLLDTWTILASMSKKLSYHSACVVEGAIYVFGGIDHLSALSTSVLVYHPEYDMWDTGTSDNQGKSHMTCSVVENVVYLYGGKITGDYTNVLRAYDTVDKTWSNKTSGPSKRHSATSALVGSKIIVFGGYDTANITTISEYNTVANTWEVLATAMPSQYLGNAIAINAWVYYYGGSSDGLYIYDSTASTWSLVKTSPGALEKYASVNNGKYIYIHGGENITSTTAELWRYDTVECTWTKLADGIRGRYDHTMEIVGGYLYVYGGVLQSGRTDIMDRYDITHNTWSTRTSSSSVVERGSSAVFGTDIYYYGGTVGVDTHSSQLRKYNTVADSWTVLTPNTVALTGVKAVTVRNKMYVYGGYNLTTKNVLYSYDYLTGEWTTLATGPTATYSYGCVATDEYIYILGGYNTITLSTILRYNILANTWSTLSPLADEVYNIDTIKIDDRVYLYSGNGGGGLLPYMTTVTLPDQVRIVSTSLPNIDSNVLSASVLLRDEDGSTVNGPITVELSRNGGEAWSGVELVKKRTFNSTIRVSGGYCNFDKNITRGYITPADITTEELSGSATTFTVDNANLSGHTDAAIPSSLVGCSVRCGTNLIKIQSITGDGTASGNIAFTGILVEGTYDITTIFGMDTTVLAPTVTPNYFKIVPSSVIIDTVVTYASRANTSIVDISNGYIAAILGNDLNNASYTFGKDGSYYVYKSNAWIEIVKTVEGVVYYKNSEAAWVPTAYASGHAAITYVLNLVAAYRMNYTELMSADLSNFGQEELSITYLPGSVFTIRSILVNAFESASYTAGSDLRYRVISNNDNAKLHGIRVLWLTE